MLLFLQLDFTEGLYGVVEMKYVGVGCSGWGGTACTACGGDRSKSWG